MMKGHIVNDGRNKLLETNGKKLNSKTMIG